VRKEGGTGRWGVEIESGTDLEREEVRVLF